MYVEMLLKKKEKKNLTLADLFVFAFFGLGEGLDALAGKASAKRAENSIWRLL